MVQLLRMNKARKPSQTHGFRPTHSIDQTLRVDVVDLAGDGMNQVAFTIRNNNNLNRANPTILVEFDPKMSPPDGRFHRFVTQVVESVSMMERSISVLRLWAHAYVDSAHRPIGVPILAEESFTPEDVRSWPEAFGNLTPYFSRHPATRFEFRGCGVANGRGLDLMKELARVWGVRVHAAKNNQGTGMYWDGPVVEARPDGTTRPIAGVPFDSLF